MVGFGNVLMEVRFSLSLFSMSERRELTARGDVAIFAGDACKYRHALPPGFVLKSQRKKEEEESKRQEITLEEFLEVEVRFPLSLSLATFAHSLPLSPFTASQTRSIQTNTSNTRNLRRMEENSNVKERCRSGSHYES